MTKFLNISTDTTLGGNSPSDAVVSSQKAVKTAVDTKQDTLVSGTNIKTINNESILGSGNINISGGGTVDQTYNSTSTNAQSGTAVAGALGTLATVASTGAYSDLSGTPTIPTVNNATLTITQGGTSKGTFTANASSNVTIALDAGAENDNSTITKNASQKLQAVALINQNSASGATNPVYDWVGTIDEYTTQAVATTHPDWLCFITNRTQTALNHYLVAVRYPNASNSYTWYFKYSDGWVEQGGFVNATQYNNTTQNVNFMIAMADTNYFAIANPNTPNHQETWAISARCAVKATTGMAVHGSNNANSAYTGQCSWMVAGMAAS